MTGFLGSTTIGVIIHKMLNIWSMDILWTSGSFSIYFKAEARNEKHDDKKEYHIQLHKIKVGQK